MIYNRKKYFYGVKFNSCPERTHRTASVARDLTGKVEILKRPTRWLRGNSGTMWAELEGVDQLTTMLKLPHFPLQQQSCNVEKG